MTFMIYQTMIYKFKTGIGKGDIYAELKKQYLYKIINIIYIWNNGIRIL